jgi:hypothetical protein
MVNNVDGKEIKQQHYMTIRTCLFQLIDYIIWIIVEII